MIHAIIEFIVSLALDAIRQFGYLGIFVTMALDAAAVPIPSEVVLPFSGFLAASGTLNLWLVTIVATIANLVGALFVYYIGVIGGHPFLEKYGRYVFIHHQDVKRLSAWLQRHERTAIFFSRLLPGVRTYSALIMGAVKEIRLSTFVIYTLLGSLLWNFVFTYVGYVAGENWNFLEPYFRKAEIGIAVILAGGLAWYIYRHIQKKTI